jgi:sulfur-oxidizing protein SoxZ
MSIKPRIRLPESVKAGDIVEVRTLVSHVMETGQRRNSEGQIVPRDLINSVVATWGGREVFRATLYPGTSANPYISFFLKVPGPGELEVAWADDAGKTTIERVKLNVVA